jgi:WD40 repeat protein
MQAPFRVLKPSAPVPQPDTAFSRPSAANKPPSVQEINRALKTNAEPTSVLGNFDASSPRALHIGRRPSSSSSSPIKPGANLGSWHAPPKHQEVRSDPQAPSQRQGHASRPVTQNITGSQNAVGRPAAASTQRQSRPTTQPVSKPELRPSYFTGPAQELQDDDKDSVLSDVSSSARPPDSVAVNVPPSPAPDPKLQAQSVSKAPPPTATATPPSTRKKYSTQFTTPEDHMLIFLKEVKRYKWSEITLEYNNDMPHRQYHTLQSHYSSVLNRRDKSLDPPTLTLPARFAAETTINWQYVHANNAVPSTHTQQSAPQQIAASTRQLHLPKQAEPRPLPVQQTIKHDYSSGADSAPHRERSRRAQRVNYTWPKQRGLIGDPMEEEESTVPATFGNVVDGDVAMRSETPPEEDAPLPGIAIAVDNDPMNLDFEAEDAEVGLNLRTGSRRASTKMVPYLTASQRLLIQNPPAGSEWDQLSSRDWQGSLVHADFSPNELKTVENAITKMKTTSTRSRHSTKRRKLRDLLKGLTESKVLQLVSTLRRCLPCRDGSSITAFLHDAMAGTIAVVPQIQRLAAARPDKNMSSVEKTSTSSILRQRELGRQSKRGWQTSSKPLTYQVKNKYMDTLGPVSCWTGASSDIHTVAWAPDGERFAAGAVAVDDPDSMQYNRPNNLLFGDTLHGTIHELAEHHKDREKTESGANSSHAMFVSQDPKLYTTVSSVAFSTSGRFMYSAGYDKHIGIWQTESVQPILAAKWNVRDQIDILAVDRTRSGILATAAKVSNQKAIRILTLDEENPSQFKKKSSFHSLKAVSRSDLKILPTALQFEPKFGGLLLAGFGANLKETGFDMTGDLCLWDVETQQQHNIHGSSRNVFDVEFNPNRVSGPVFAVGCVANGNVNRGTRSTVRLYDVKGPDKFTCPIELDCRALDMNDVVWCPHDEYLIAAGCTDGRAYVWDWRWPDAPLRVLSHSRSLMPLQDGVKHEVTDTGVRFLSWGQNATRLYSGSSDGVVKVWDVTRAEENTFIKDLVTTDSGIMSGAFSGDYSKLVLGEVNGSVSVLEVGRDDCSIKDADRLRYMPYEDVFDEQEDNITGNITRPLPESGVAEGDLLLQTGQVQLAPMGSLPIRQIVQGPNYAGPFDQGVDAPFLREQALEFQLSLTTPPGPQCSIPACKANHNKTTSEDVGDSGRSSDRIPDSLRRQWKAIDSSNRDIIPGKSKCSNCTRPALPSLYITSDPHAAEVLCERCSFACFRCGAVNPVAPATTTLICDSCAGIWDIGALGYECVQQPVFAGKALDVPSLKKWDKEVYGERLEDVDAGFGDEVNALTEYYLGLAISRPESPPL